MFVCFVRSWRRPTWPKRSAITCLIDWFCYVFAHQDWLACYVFCVLSACSSSSAWGVAFMLKASSANCDNQIKCKDSGGPRRWDMVRANLCTTSERVQSIKLLQLWYCAGDSLLSTQLQTEVHTYLPYLIAFHTLHRWPTLICAKRANTAPTHPIYYCSLSNPQTVVQTQLKKTN